MGAETSRLTTLRAIWATLDDLAVGAAFPDMATILDAIEGILATSGEPPERWELYRSILAGLSPHYWHDWLLGVRVAAEYGVTLDADETTPDRRPLRSERCGDLNFRRDFNTVITHRERLRQKIGVVPPRPPYADFPLIHHN